MTAAVAGEGMGMGMGIGTGPAAAIVLLLLAALALYLASHTLRRHSGLPRGEVVYADTGAWQRNERPLYSAAYRVTGKPDYLVRDGGAVIPVEVKSGPAPSAPREGHVAQLALYCLLVEEELGLRPPYGLIHYADKTFKVPYTDGQRQGLLDLLGRMRQDVLSPAGPHRSHRDPRRCAGCGLRESCDERLG